MRNIRILIKNIRDGFKNVIRNFSLSLASISCITVTLLIVAFAIVGSYNVENFTKVIRDDFTIVVYMNNSNTEETEAKIKDSDIRVDVYRSSGAGGQGVNTTDSAVRITHLPTGIVVTCQNERSQLKNKEQAMVVLKSKLYALEEQKKIEESEEYKKGQSSINFGSQIRSYVMHPYSMVKDHRTNYETSNVSKVLDGDIDEFIESYLNMSKE